MRDLLGVRISEGTVLNIRQPAARQVGAISRGLDLLPVRVGLHDEIFQASQPVLAGVDASSTCCYLLQQSNIATPIPGAFTCSMLSMRV